ncbi:E3 ubiquitin-protein ligase NHLRC1 [Collichthys lucidus]|uniref:RING-type E3 ubiquitin transferase n=1 Tax=Collichthys lucidus TaxID=240159 RepID=A0A4U5V651_COLLU|nr:E3 ubiquitin-protein ligase NHLRC1 [Collichthys lucidus]
MAKTPGSPSRGSLSPEGILREIQINLLECKVCFEKFSTQQREHRPQTLSCGHVLCRECITALSHPLLRKLECPFCRQLCSIDSTSHCLVLTDLQELLLSYAPPHRPKGGLGSATSPTSAALHLCAAFGGWGTLINPTGIAILGSSETMVVVHDAEKTVVVFSSQGKKLQSFGQKGRASEEICYPVDVAVTPCGYVVVTDAGDKAVKVFTSRGKHVLTVKNSFKMPWGVDTDSCGHILVSDVQAGTLSQTDSFCLTLQSMVKLNMSGVTFGRDGDVIVIDSNQGMIWSLGKLQNGPALTPLVGDHLVRPTGLVSLNNMLVVLDSGDHTVKIYSAKADAGPII